MTQDLKDQLVTLLDTVEKREKYGYILEAHHRHPNSKPYSCVAWDIRLYPKGRCIWGIEVIINIALTIDDIIQVSLCISDEPYLTLI